MGCFIFFKRVDPICVAAVELESEIENNIADNVENILGDIDSNGLDDFLIHDSGFSFLETNSFKDLVVKVLNGNYFEEYDSLSDFVMKLFKENASSLLSLFLTFLVIVVLFELFKNISPERYSGLQKIVGVVFSLLTLFLLIIIFKDLSDTVTSLIKKIFSFAKIIFPILLSLVLLSGASGSHAVYGGMSVFLLDAGMKLFIYFLLPISVSIFILSIFGASLSNKRLTKMVDIFKIIFKYSIVGFFILFGLISTVNLVVSGVKDGFGLKLTKYALKNYIPVLGGYISDGFDYVRSCSVLIKNAFGLCGIVFIVFMIIKPMIMYASYMFMFKILSLFSSFIGTNFYVDVFDNASKSVSYFITVLMGVFLIFVVFLFMIIVSVSVV